MRRAGTNSIKNQNKFQGRNPSRLFGNKSHFWMEEEIRKL